MAGSETQESDDGRRSALMAAAQAGDRTAYAALLRECVPLVRSIARARGVPPAAVDDAVQDTLLTIHRARHTYDPRRPFSAWLTVIADRRARDILRRARRHQAREVHAPIHYEQFPDDGARPQDQLGSRQAWQRAVSAMSGLPPRQREAVDLLLLRGQSLTEAAATTRRSKGALKVNLHRALAALRIRLREED
jgi:RNA polymerase sigma-70 factor (ECF subfamily)